MNGSAFLFWAIQLYLRNGALDYLKIDEFLVEDDVNEWYGEDEYDSEHGWTEPDNLCWF